VFPLPVTRPSVLRRGRPRLRGAAARRTRPCHPRCLLHVGLHLIADSARALRLGLHEDEVPQSADNDDHDEDHDHSNCRRDALLHDGVPPFADGVAALAQPERPSMDGSSSGFSTAPHPTFLLRGHNALVAVTRDCLDWWTARSARPSVAVVGRSAAPSQSLSKWRFERRRHILTTTSDGALDVGRRGPESAGGPLSGGDPADEPSGWPLDVDGSVGRTRRGAPPRESRRAEKGERRSPANSQWTRAQPDGWPSGRELILPHPKEVAT